MTLPTGTVQPLGFGCVLWGLWVLSYWFLARLVLLLLDLLSDSEHGEEVKRLTL